MPRKRQTCHMSTSLCSYHRDRFVDIVVQVYYGIPDYCHIEGCSEESRSVDLVMTFPITPADKKHLDDQVTAAVAAKLLLGETNANRTSRTQRYAGNLKTNARHPSYP